MKKSEYIQKAKVSILNRVKFHAPVLYDARVDYSSLKKLGVNVALPIFKFDKTLNDKLFKAFVLANRQQPFNLMLSASSLGKVSHKKLQKMGNVFVYEKEKCSKSFVEAVNKLNINYCSNSNYNLIYKDKFFKVNGQILNPHYDDFMLVQKFALGDIFVQHCEFVLNGSNQHIKVCNNSTQPQKVEIEVNIPLARGYYYFKRLRKSILIENLLTKQKHYFNFFAPKAQFSFSSVDGLENSVFACVNLKMTISLKSKQETSVFCNFGQSCFSVARECEIEQLKKVSLEKCHETFNVKVKTKNPSFDHFFNFALPQKIWICWLNGESDASLEAKYLGLKRLFVKGKESLTFVPFREIGLRELGIFNGEYYKKIFVVSGDEKFLKVGQTTFHNISGITKASLENEQPLCVCFGQ